MKVNEKALIKAGYTFCKDEHHYHCDKFYQKSFPKDSNGFTRCIEALYYEEFDDYEFRLVEEHDKYWTSKLIYGIDKDMTLEQIESKLIGE